MDSASVNYGIVHKILCGLFSADCWYDLNWAVAMHQLFVTNPSMGPGMVST